MPEMPPTLIRQAALFRANDLSIGLLLRSWGDEDRVLIRVAPAPGQWRDPLGDWINGRWRDQSPLLSYWGPLIGSPDSLVDPIKSRAKDSLDSAYVQGLVETYLLSQLDLDLASGLRRQLKTHLRNITLSNLVDGENAGACSIALGLASAQQLAVKLAAQIQLVNEDYAVLRLLLTKAPLQFGYWGPFKAALKYLDPALMPNEFGVALARLSEPSRSIGGSPDVEDLGWMDIFTDIPSERTLQYMSRRLRRQLATIGRTDPDLYASISAPLLQAWDSELGPCSYLPAYVLGGAQSVLNKTGRFVALPLLQGSRRDPHPEAWANHRGLIRHLLTQVKVSVETLTFASQILLEADEALPELQAGQLLLTLRSSDSRLVTRGCAVLPQHPEEWGALQPEHWQMFMAHAELDPLNQVLGAQKQDPLPAAVSAAVDLLVSMEPCSSLQAQEQSRSRLISEFYIDAITAPHGSLRFYADSSATASALVCLGSVVRFAEGSELWASRLNQLNSFELLGVYSQLVAAGMAFPDNLTALESVISSAELYDYQLQQLTLQAFQIPGLQSLQLGWKLFDRCENADWPFDAVWGWLSENDRPEAFTPQAWEERRLHLLAELLARSTDITARLNELLLGENWGLNVSSLAALIIDSPTCLHSIWQALVSDEEDELSGLKEMIGEHPQLVLAMGDVLQADDLSVVSPWQQQLLLLYVRDRDRVRSDLSFAVSTVGLGEPNLQRECLEQLRRFNALEHCWLRLAELGLPVPLETVRHYLEELETTGAFTDAVLACVDSIVPVVRDLGFDLIDSHNERIDHDRLWSSLSHSDDPVVQARVADESIFRSWSDREGLASFDRRLLVSRRTNRRAKIQVQARLNSEQLLSPERRAALLDLARGANRQDREWALRRIAELTLSGVPLDGVSVQTVTPTDSTGGAN